MKKSTRAKLEKAGWAVGSVQDFLGLSDTDAELEEAGAALTEAKKKGARSLRGLLKGMSKAKPREKKDRL
jgi:hypothetical protein